MLKTRVIPVLFLMNGLIVRSEGFSKFQIIGNPVDELERYSQWRADELVYVDITREGGHDIRREDHRVKSAGDDIVSILRQIARSCFMPLTFGGRIESLDQVNAFIRNGADKVLINSAAHRNPGLVTEVAETHGSQAMVAGIDVKREYSMAYLGVLLLDMGRAEEARKWWNHGRAGIAVRSDDYTLNGVDRSMRNALKRAGLPPLNPDGSFPA